MTIKNRILLCGVGFAAFAAAAPATAQYAFSHTSNVAAQRCAAAVENRLSYQGTNVLGVRTAGRVLTVTQVDPRRNIVRVRGLASSGVRDPIGAYGMLGANYSARPDLSFRCDVDYRGYVRYIDIDRRR